MYKMGFLCTVAYQPVVQACGSQWRQELFYSPSARTSLNKPAQSSCTQRRLSCCYHYDFRVKRMSRRSEWNMGEYAGVGGATDRGSCGRSWSMGLLSITSVGLQFHKFVPCTGNPSHRFSFPEDGSKCDKRPGLNSVVRPISSSDPL